MSDGLHKVGEPIGDVPPSVFELIIEDHIAFADPKDFGLSDIDSVDPKDYFVTSGDAVEKAKVLERDAWRLAGDLRKNSQEHTPSGARARYEAAVWKAAGQARRLLNALKKAKGDDCFLETEWDNHKLLCIPKNPRK